MRRNFGACDGFSDLYLFGTSIKLVRSDICYNGCAVFVVGTGLDRSFGTGFGAHRWQSWGGVS